MKEALKLALEALESMKETLSEHDEPTTFNEDEAITALKEALAQPEQETQAYREAAQLAKRLFKKHYAQEEHYASGRVVWGLCDTTAGVILQIENMVCKLVLPKEPEQEPVAWMRQDGQRVVPANDRSSYPDYKTRYSIPLYTTPPQRTWVGLTDEEEKDK